MTDVRQSPRWPCGIATTVAVGCALAALVIEVDDGGPSSTQAVVLALVALWVAAGVMLCARQRQGRLGKIALAGTSVAGLLCLSQAATGASGLSDTAADATQVGIRLTAALLPAIALHLFLALPDGRLDTALRHRETVAGYVVALLTGAAMCADLDAFPAAPIVTLWAVGLGLGVAAATQRYRRASALAQRRLQWIGWALSIAVIGAITVVVLALLADWPHTPGAVALAMTGFVPIAFAAGTVPKLVVQIDRLLTGTVALAGLTALILGIYALVELILGRRPQAGERSVLLLSMLAAAAVAVLFVPTTRWLTERANRLVYGTRVAPDEAVRTFGQRLTRSIPLDELLLQLTENLRSSMALKSAEVWTGQDGRYERTAGVPHRQPPAIVIGPEELPVVSRAGVSGGTWLDIWLPQVGGAGSSAMRVAPIAHAGLLLGFIAVTRNPDGEPFGESEDGVLAEVARQIGLALHNAQLDTALQASLEELQLSNQQLQDSRARIVSAGDDERRRLERNLHDGAQQHLVALAVKLRLARDAVEDDPPDAVAMIDEIKSDVQTAITELRALAHGIFPPLLASGGLREALPAAATRAALPTTVTCDATGRYGNDIEAAVYFCTLEALQNAGKHAGATASATVAVDETDGILRFEVSDDGVGFDMRCGAANGHGFVNIADRLGAFGGSVTVTSAPGRGTTIAGTIPLP